MSPGRPPIPDWRTRSRHRPLLQAPIDCSYDKRVAEGGLHIHPTDEPLAAPRKGLRSSIPYFQYGIERAVRVSNVLFCQRVRNPFTIDDELVLIPSRGQSHGGFPVSLAARSHRCRVRGPGVKITGDRHAPGFTLDQDKADVDCLGLCGALGWRWRRRFLYWCRRSRLGGRFCRRRWCCRPGFRRGGGTWNLLH